MKLEESSIYISLKQLRRKLYQAQFLMDKSARIVYGTPLMESCREALHNFILSFEIREEREIYIRKMYGHWICLKEDLELCIIENIIHFKKNKSKKELTLEESVSTAKIELFKLIADIDEDMGKWFGSHKGKTIIA